MKANQILAILLARGWIVLTVWLVTVAATAVVTLLLPRMYTASTSLVLEPRLTDVLGGNATGSAPLPQTYLSTQIDIMQSQRVAVRVVRMLGLPESPTAIRQFQEATKGVGSIEDYFAELLLRRLEVRPSRESNLVTLNFSGNDPRFAAQVADAFAQAYIDVTLELRTEPARQYAGWFSEQLKTLRTDMEGAQARLSEFQQRHGIVGSEERLDVENARLAELSSQLVAAQAQAVDARSRSSFAAPSVQSVPDVSMTPVLQSLRSELLRSEARLQEMSGIYGPEHPSYRRQREETESLRQRLETELRNASGAVGSVSRASAKREAELRAAVDAQKQRVLEIKRQRDEMGVLMRQAENAQRVYDVALQRLAQNSLESQVTQTTAAILNRAAIPAAPSSPRTALNMILSTILGFLVGVAAAILFELSDRRVRSGADLDDAGLQVPLLGQLRPRRRRLQLRLPGRGRPLLPGLREGTG